MARSFVKRRTKHNLIFLLISILFLFITILSYFSPGTLFSIGGITLQIIIWAVVLIALFILLFYKEIHNFISRSKTKKK